MILICSVEVFLHQSKQVVVPAETRARPLQPPHLQHLQPLLWAKKGFILPNELLENFSKSKLDQKYVQNISLILRLTPQHWRQRNYGIHLFPKLPRERLCCQSSMLTKNKWVKKENLLKNFPRLLKPVGNASSEKSLTRKTTYAKASEFSWGNTIFLLGERHAIFCQENKNVSFVIAHLEGLYPLNSLLTRRKWVGKSNPSWSDYLLQTLLSPTQILIKALGFLPHFLAFLTVFF